MIKISYAHTPYYIILKYFSYGKLIIFIVFLISNRLNKPIFYDLFNSPLQKTNKNRIKKYTE